MSATKDQAQAPLMPLLTGEDGDSTLRVDVRQLGDLLGETLVRQGGAALLELVEKVRKITRESKAIGDGAQLLSKVDIETSITLARAFSNYFQLANIAEQVHRARTLSSERAQKGSWLAQTIDRIKESGASTEEVQAWVEVLAIRPVFTAHPTEAARRSVLSKLATIARLLDKPHSSTRAKRLAEAVDLLWQTDELRLGRPEPLDEARNAIYYLDDLYRETVPEVLDTFAAELARLGVNLSPTARPLTFGSWIGGDRDGNPNVTAKVTSDTIVLQVGHAIRDAVEKQWDKDLPAYKRLRQGGHQPPSTDGCADLEARATTAFEIEAGEIMEGQEKEINEGISVMNDVLSSPVTTEMTTPVSALKSEVA